MLPLTINNFSLYFSIVWGANILLNLLYVIKKYYPELQKYDFPLDFKIKLSVNRLLGESTTVVGLILSFFIGCIIYFFTNSLMWSTIPILVYFGHAIGSFIKRRFNKKDGEFMLFVDHGDYSILTGIIFIFLGYISFSFAILSIILTYVLHPIACYWANKFGLKKNPY